MELIRLEYQIGKENITKIKNTSVLVIGLGGVGGYAVESLIRSGIENIILVDADIIEKSNINRQIIALQSTIGMKKVDAFENRILDINPNIKVKKISEFIKKENLHILFETKIDFVIDDFGDRKYIQVADYLSSDEVVEREFGAYKAVEDNYPKYVITMDKLDYSRDGIIHKNIIDFLLSDKMSLSS